jgi:hypothetical protein
MRLLIINLQQSFQSVERLYSIEFDRDWNLNSIALDQSLLSTGLVFQLQPSSLNSNRGDHVSI